MSLNLSEPLSYKMGVHLFTHLSKHARTHASVQFCIYEVCTFLGSGHTNRNKVWLPH